jgi:tripartite-type tricarboxylate transporter receptor subunit TctC
MPNLNFSLFSLSRRALITCALAGSLVAPGVWAQGYPNKPIRLMVGYSAGGGVDTVARLLASRLPALLGQQVVVENRPGAAGLIAADLVAKSAPDGYTLLMGESALLIAKVLQPKMPMDPLTQFQPVVGAFVSPLVIVTSNDFPAKTPGELVSPGGIRLPHQVLARFNTSDSRCSSRPRAASWCTSLTGARRRSCLM